MLQAPGDWGADIVVGPTQPLGVHMNCGGGVGGYMASRDEERFVREYNGFLVSITGTAKPGQFGFGLRSSHQTSYGMRELGKDWTGNSVYLWAIANAVYLALLGPPACARSARRSCSAEPMRRGVLGGDSRRAGSPSPASSRSSWSTSRHRQIGGRDQRRPCAEQGIFGGKDLSAEFPEWGQSALYCVTEIHAQADIDRLAAAVAEAVR